MRAFPEHITLEGCPMTLVDDEFIARVHKGDEVLGWEGDERFAVYIDFVARTWNLLFRTYATKRAPEEYRVVARFSADGYATADIAGAMVLWILDHDSRRVDVAQQVWDHNDALEAARWKALEEWTTEAVERRLDYALRQ